MDNSFSLSAKKIIAVLDCSGILGSTSGSTSEHFDDYPLPLKETFQNEKQDYPPNLAIHCLPSHLISISHGSTEDHKAELINIFNALKPDILIYPSQQDGDSNKSNEIFESLNANIKIAVYSYYDPIFEEEFISINGKITNLSAHNLPLDYLFPFEKGRVSS